MCELGYAIPTFEYRLIFTHLSVIYGWIRGNKNCTKKTIISGSQALLNLALFGTTKKYIFFFWSLFQNPNAEALGLFSQSHLFYWNESLQKRIYQHTHTHIIDQEKETHITSFSLALPTQKDVFWKMKFQFVWNFVMFHNQHFICIIFNLILNMLHSSNFFFTPYYLQLTRSLSLVRSLLNLWLQ